MGFTGCDKKRCEVCVKIYEAGPFFSTVIGETFKNNHKLDCDNKCLIYLFMCKCCGKQYVGETTEEFKFGWNHYKCNDLEYTKTEDCFQEHLLDIPIVGNI